MKALLIAVCTILIAVAICAQQQEQPPVAVDVSLTGATTATRLPPAPMPSPLRQVSNLQHFSNLISDSIVTGDFDTIVRFMDDKTSFVSFPFNYRYRDNINTNPFTLSGSENIKKGLEKAKGVLADFVVHCTGKVFKSGSHEACESMYLLVQNGHWTRLQVHGINVLEMAPSSPLSGGPKIAKWASYFNDELLGMQVINEVTANEYRNRDHEGYQSNTSPVGMATKIFNQFMADHEVIPINYYSVNYLTAQDRERMRTEFQPKFFIPRVFNESGKGVRGGYFTDDVEFAVPIGNVVTGFKNAQQQYTDFLKNVERAYLFLESPVHILPKPKSQSNGIVKGSVALTYSLFLKDNFPNKRIVCEGIALFEIDPSKSTSQFSSFKYIFNDDTVLVQLGNKSNVRVVSSNK
jgi:hypothetical protein